MRSMSTYRAWTFRSLLALALVGLALGATAATCDRGERVHRIDSVDLARLTGGQFRVVVEGHVNSGGWSNPRLVPRDFRSDGYYYFEFLADPPRKGDIVTMGFVSVSAGYSTNLPRGMRGVKIFTRDNRVVVQRF